MIIKWQKIGQYLDRSVKIGKINSLEEYSRNSSLASSNVMLCFDVLDLMDLKLKSFYEQLAQSHPLTILICGKNSENNFSILLDSIYSKKSKKFIMTAVNKDENMQEWIEQLFWATWPSEERFDEWKENRILVIGDDNFYNKIKSKINQFLQKK